MLSPEQIEIRSTGLGASEAAGALGVSRYASPWSVWARKLGLIPPPRGWALQRGHALEPLMLAWYAEQTGASLSEPGTLRHPKAACILATPDAAATMPDGARGLVECKAPSSRTAVFWGEPGTDEIDPEYLPQVLQQLEVTGLPWVDVVASIAGDEPRLYRVHAAPKLQERILGRLCAFWDRFVIGREPPRLDGSDEVQAWISTTYPRSSGIMLEATEQIEAMALERRALATEIEARSERKATIENELRLIIADADGIEGAFGRVTWRRDRNGRRNLRFTYTQE